MINIEKRDINKTTDNSPKRVYILRTLTLNNSPTEVSSLTMYLGW